MSFLDWFRKKEQEVEDVVEDVVSIVSGPFMTEIMVVLDKVVENGNNPIVIASLAELGINEAEVALAIRAFQVVKALVSKVEVAVQAKAEHEREIAHQ